MEKEKKEFEEKVIEVNRVSRTVKGGRRLRFRTLVAIGNLKGKVGIGIGKANEVVVAVNKAVNKAKKNLIDVPITQNDSIPHEVNVHFGGAHIFLKPAGPGTSVIAGSTIRTVIELAGIKNILSKAHGSSSKINNVQATIIALASLSKNPNNISKSKSDENVVIDSTKGDKLLDQDPEKDKSKKAKDEIKPDQIQ